MSRTIALLACLGALVLDLMERALSGLAEAAAPGLVELLEEIPR